MISLPVTQQLENCRSRREISWTWCTLSMTTGWRLKLGTTRALFLVTLSRCVRQSICRQFNKTKCARFGPSSVLCDMSRTSWRVLQHSEWGVLIYICVTSELYIRLWQELICQWCRSWTIQWCNSLFPVVPVICSLAVVIHIESWMSVM